ncbi:replicative DNA helicase [Streptomyces sp. SID3343]|uniref:replicative DNA helicase n=1 Tax=Streptomyces sp. SID3343 TaxID=2690260 RepID=UPI001370542D|nr:replicative DNA helicase [Streptomyces sp. SID3343]MYV98133.1 replicative DNA helicase [Streptomyces sp. SID3343]
MSVSEFEEAPPEPSREGFERTPPQDIAAEQSVLGGMMLSKDAIADVVENLKPIDFYRPAHELVYNAILDLYARGEPADAVTVAAELTKRTEIGRVGGAPYLHTLISSVPTAANAEYYARIVREQAVLRRLVEAGTRIVQMGYAADGEVDDIVNNAQAEVYKVTEQRTTEDYAPLADIMEGALDEIEAIGSRGGQMSGIPTGFSDLDSLTNGLHSGQMIVIAARPAMGKALALDTPLPTPSGWTTMGEVRVGDLLVGADGAPTRVVAATEVLIDRPCYEVEFSDGAVIVADGRHQWVTETHAERRAARDRTDGSSFAGTVRTTEEIAATLVCETADHRSNHAVRVAAPARFPERDLLLPPYVLGAWLGDGNSAGSRFTTADSEIVDHIEREGIRVLPGSSHLLYNLRLPEPTAVAERACVVCGKPFVPRTSRVRSCGKSCGGKAKAVSAPVAAPVCPDCGRPSSGPVRCQACRDRHGTVPAILRTLGVLNDKHIPQSYLRASEQQRRDLLAGLLDTDGHVSPSGTVQFAVTNRRLAEGALELVLGLGYRATMRTKQVEGRSAESSVCYQVDFTPADKVFRLTRKIARQSAPDHPTTRLRHISAVRRVDSVPVRCVEVDNENHLYLAGRSWIPTHNSTLGLDIARACSIKNGLASVIFSLEMGRNEIMMRLLSAEARVALHHMRSGSMTDDDWTRLSRKMGEVTAAPMYIDDSPNLSMMEIRAKCRRLKQKHDLRLVIIDYLQLMQAGGSRRAENRQQEVSEMSRNLKLLAKELEVPVVAMSQLNRGPEQRTDKKPMVSDLRESGSIEQDADMVILLHREDAYEKESPRAGEADLIVAKHRNGPTATITVAFQGHYSRFVDMAQS